MIVASKSDYRPGDTLVITYAHGDIEGQPSVVIREATKEEYLNQGDGIVSVRASATRFYEVSTD